jgi:eukaryotic-like serine/threonine-protein kinase
MTPAGWDRVQELFHSAVGLAPAEREALLTKTGDAELASEVLTLLAGHDRSGPVSAAEPAAGGDEPGRIGAFRIERRIGEGGMSVVYQAEREGDGFRQRVALKLARAGYADPELAQRLAAERRILARLEHPGIARLIDGGTTEAGQPYFAMEYVDGTSLLAHAEENRLPLAERLRLFLSVCEAVQYAHQQFVVHRDLKPTNILVTAAGQPKLLDFGIASLLDRPGAEGAAAPWLTPAYASPEQVWGDPVGPLSDVYSLGVVLYELVAGCRPYDLASRSSLEIARVILEKIPDPPSRTPGGRGLGRDLDSIVLKAMAKSPAQRYRSVAELADDLERYRTGHPVQAHGRGTRYRFGKVVRRHRWAAAAVAVAVVSLVGGAGVALWQAATARAALARAELALAESEESQGLLYELFESNDPAVSGGRPITAPEMMERGLHRAEQLQDQPALQSRMLTSIGRVYNGLSEPVKASAVLEQAVAAGRAGFGDRSPELVEPLRHLARAYRDQGRLDQADSCYQLALGIVQADHGHVHPLVADVLLDLARVALDRGENEAGRRLVLEAREIRRATLGANSPAVAATIVIMGSIERRTAHYREAERLYREALDMYRAARGSWDGDVAAARLQIAMLLRDHLGDLEEARVEARKAVLIQRRVLGPTHPSRTWGLMTLALTEERLGHREPAESLVRESLQLATEAYGPNHPAVIDGMFSLAAFLARQGEDAEALRLGREALAMARRWPDAGQGVLPGALQNMAGVELVVGRPLDGDRHAREAFDLLAPVLGPDHLGRLNELLADLALARHDSAGAARYLRQAHRILARELGADHPDVRRDSARLDALAGAVRGKAAGVLSGE